jgi:catechol 2,3-dioxygenase-like lactoylglutathione lyase family enzyme
MPPDADGSSGQGDSAGQSDIAGQGDSAGQSDIAGQGDTARPSDIAGFDHIALPLRDADRMIAFYRSLGLSVTENRYLVQVYVGDQMINFHRPELWERDFDLRAPAAQPPCGDVCFVWQGSPQTLQDLLDRAGADIIEGPVAREGGRRAAGTSVYVRDPDGNLVEFLNYREESGHGG